MRTVKIEFLVNGEVVASHEHDTNVPVPNVGETLQAHINDDDYQRWQVAKRHFLYFSADSGVMTVQLFLQPVAVEYVADLSDGPWGDIVKAVDVIQPTAVLTGKQE